LQTGRVQSDPRAAEKLRKQPVMRGQDPAARTRKSWTAVKPALGRSGSEFSPFAQE